MRRARARRGALAHINIRVASYLLVEADGDSVLRVGRKAEAAAERVPRRVDLDHAVAVRRAAVAVVTLVLVAGEVEGVRRVRSVVAVLDDLHMPARGCALGVVNLRAFHDEEAHLLVHCLLAAILPGRLDPAIAIRPRVGVRAAVLVADEAADHHPLRGAS